MTKTMTPEAAQAVWAHLLPQIETSRQLTRQLIQNFPAAQLETRPVPHLGSFADMLWYLSSVPHVFLDGVCEGRFAELPGMPEARTTASFLAWDDEHFGPTLEKLRRLSGEVLLEPVSFAGMTQSKLDFVSAYLGNVTHHTAQVMAFLTVVMPELASQPAASSPDSALTDDQLNKVAGGVDVTFHYNPNLEITPNYQATLGGLFGPPSSLNQGLLPLAGIPGMAINLAFILLRMFL